MKSSNFLIIIGLAVAFFFGCGDVKNPLPQNVSEIQSRRTSGTLGSKGGVLSILPLTVGLAPGDEFSFKTQLMNGAGEAVRNPTGLIYSSSNPQALESRGDGRFVAKQVGEAKATVTQGDLKAEAIVTVAAPAACSALKQFTDKVQPLLNGKCVACHSDAGGAVANGAFSVNPSGGDAAIVSKNWLAAKSKLDVQTPKSSKILQKISGATSHGGGTIFADSTAEFTDFNAWADAEAKCLRGDVVTLIALSPAETTVKSGARLKLTVKGTNATGATTELTSGVTWQIEKDGAPATIDIATITSDGTVTAGSKLGTFKVIAKFESLQAAATITVIGGEIPEPTCLAFQTYKTDVEPILQQSCLSCHATGGVGSSSLSLAGPSPTYSEIKGNHAQLLKRVDLSYVDKSLLLGKITARIAHSGGAVLPVNGVPFGKVSAWAEAESTCFKAEVTTLVITPQVPHLLAGDSVQLRLMVVHKDETRTEAAAGVEWSLGTTGLPAGTTLSTTGTLSTSEPGTFTVKAKLGTTEASTTVTVSPVPTTGVVAITIMPVSVSLTVGGVRELSIQVDYQDGTHITNPPGLSLTSSNDVVAGVSGRIVSAKAVGSAQLSTTFGGISQSVNVTVAAATNCGSLQSFVDKVQPIIEEKCAVCHGAASNAAAVALELKSISATQACQQRYANWSHAKGELNYASLLDSQLLAKPLGLLAHSGGIQLDPSQTNSLMEWMNDAAACRAAGAAGETASVTELCIKIPVSITLSPVPLVVKVGSNADVIATVTYDDGTTSTTDSTLAFMSSNTALVTTQKTAVGAQISGVAAGSAVLTVTAGKASVTANVTVQAADVVLTSLEVEPLSAPSVGIGKTQVFKLFGKYSDGTRVQKTTGVTWSVADTSKATIATNGILTAKAAGTTTVTSMLTGCSPLASCASTRNVTVLGVKTVTVTPASKSLTLGQTQQLSVTVAYTNDSTAIMTTGITWSSSSTTIATVSTTGLVTAKGAGTAIISATFGGVIGSSSITVVVPDGCPSIATFRATGSNIASIMGQKCASCHQGSGSGTGVFSFPGLGTDCPSQVEDWRAAKVKVDLKDPSKSLFVVKPTGRVAHAGGILLTTTQGQLFEAWATKEAQCAAAGLADSTNINTLCPKTAVAISITPTAPDIVVNTGAALVVKVTYDDGSSVNTTSGVTWTSSATAIATIDQTGNLVGIAPGTATITAKMGSLSASVLATIRAAGIVMTRIHVVPTTQSVPVGESVTYKVKATYSDSSTKELSSEVTWTSTDTTKANIVASTGVATGVAIGTSTVKGTLASCTNIANCPASGTVTVTTAILKSIAISPADIALTSGLSQVLKVMGTYSDGMVRELTTGITWSTADTDLLVLSTTGEVTGRSPGFSIVKARVSGLAEASTGVLVLSANGCTTVSDYQTNIDPIVQSKCIACHGGGGPGNSYMPLKGPNPSSFDKLNNWDEMRRRVSSSDVASSKLIKKVSDAPTGYHSGGAVLPLSTSVTSDYGKVLTWATSEAQCIKENIPSNLTRNSGEVLYLRLAKLFPSAPAQTSSSLYKLVARDFDMFYSRSLDRVLANTERNFSTVTLIAMRAKVNALCNDYVVSADESSGLFIWSGTLRAGESVPTDAVDKIILAAARNAWLYPYVATDGEVGALRTLYNGALSASTALQAKKMVCVAVLSAPQFWFGNKGELDSVRRVHLETLRHVPTMADYDAYGIAADKKAFLKGLLETSSYLSGYYSAAKSWHRDWLGLRDYYDILAGSIRPESTAVGGSLGAAGTSGMVVARIPDTDSGLVGALELGLDRNTNDTNSADFSESCAKGLQQEFDPRTTEVRVEHFNPVNSAWEIVGSMKKSGGTWLSIAGSITLADGTKKTTSLSDITVTSANAELKQCYAIGGLVGTPLQCFYGPRFGKLQTNGTYLAANSKSYMQRRIRRFSPSGEQNGYSKVKLWYTGEETSVCNTYSRFAMACYYRPSTKLLPITGGINYTTGIIGSELTPWNFGSNDRPKMWFPSLRDSYGSPKVLDAFRCGVPNSAAIAKLGTTTYDENAAYPLGYTSMTGSIDPVAINKLAVNPTETFNKSKYSIGLDMVIDANLASARSEEKGVGRFLQDLQDEPLALANDIIKNNRDYKLLLTADYTLGRTELELFYRSSGYYLPAYPPGYVPHLGADNTVRVIREADIAPIPLAWLQNSWGELGRGLTATYMKDELAAGEVAPKPMSGVLTQSAFLGPVSVNSGKMRSIAARFFSRLLCGLPSDFVADLDANATQLHRSLISTAGPGGKAHVDETKGCYSCHINLDPMASALRPGFKSYPDSPGIADMKYAPFLGVLYHYGVRGGKPAGSGAIFGTPVNGIKEVGVAIAGSRQFSECVVKTGFQNVFGRAPIGDEMGMINDIATSFRTTLHFNYTNMIEELISSETFRRAN